MATGARAISRRALLSAAAALAMRPARSVRAQGSQGSVLAYVGTYTGNGEGIYLFSLNLRTGALTQIKTAAKVPSPSWLAIHPNGNFLYAANEISNFTASPPSGSVTAFAINRATGDLTMLNTVSSKGAGPAHLSVDPLGKFVFVANYGGGSFAVLPVHPDGSLADASFVQAHVDSVGPARATNAPAGSFAISGHEAPHPHMIQADPAGKYVLGADLGQDRIYTWLLNRETGQLVPASPPFVAVSPGDGPRHFAFHPNGRFLYSLQEEASTLLFYHYDPSSGSLTERQRISTLPAGFAGTNFTSEVRVSGDGAFVYAANRLHDSIAVFKVGATGSLSPAGEAPTRGDYPRSFTIDPSGRFLVVCNQRSDALVTYRIKGSTLVFAEQYAPVGNPASIVFLA
jgi:6-phosphogluconolactonase